MFSITQEDRFSAKKGVFTLESIRKAYAEQSPKLAELIWKLIRLDPAPRLMFLEEGRGGLTFSSIHHQILMKTSEQRTILKNDPKAKTEGESGRISRVYSAPYVWRGHQAVWEHLTSDTMKDLLPERVGVHEIIMQLWNDNTPYAREQLLNVLRFVDLKYGAWKAIKTIFKEAELRFDWEVYGILDQRWDNLSWYRSPSSPSYRYISEADQEARDAEETLIREQEERLATLEAQKEGADEATQAQIDLKIGELNEALQTAYHNRNHEPSVSSPSLFEAKSNKYGDHEYNNNSSTYNYDPSNKTLAYLKRRACRVFRHLAKDFPESFASAATEMLMGAQNTYASYFVMDDGYTELWTAEALFKVVEQSKSSNAVDWAYNLLKERFRSEMREVDAYWLYRVSQSKYDFIHNLAYDYLENVTAVEKGLFYKVGYHKTIIGFLGFDMVEHESNARNFAVKYLTMMGADSTNTWLTQELSLANVSRMMRSKYRELRTLGQNLLNGNNGTSVYEVQLADKTVGLQFFSMLLNDQQTVEFAKEEIRRRYTGLTPDWFREQLNSPIRHARMFAQQMLMDSTMVASDADWADFSMELLREIKEVDYNDNKFELAWQKLMRLDEHQQKLIQDRERIPIEFLRFLFVHPAEKVRGYALKLIEEQICTPVDLGVDFLKTIATKREYKAQLDREHPWKQYLGDNMPLPLAEYLKDNIDGNVYGQNVGAKVRSWLSNQTDFSLSDLGLEWVFERLQWWSNDYTFVRDIFERDVTLEEISTLLPPLTKEEFVSDSAIVNGARQIAWYIYNKCMDAGSKKANFYKKLLMDRNPRHRAHKRLPAMADNQVWPQETFDFQWFTRWTRAKREPIRAFAIELSRYEMSYWVESGNVGFKQLEKFFEGYFDAQKAILRAIYKPLSPVNSSQIDVGLPGFKAIDLYKYCFTDSDRKVDFALNLILEKPTLFGKPDDLLSLSDSKNARVRQTVIMVMWQLYKVSTIQPGWRPFAYSVVPFDPSKAIDPERVANVDPNTLTGKQATFGENKWFMGPGTKPEVLTRDTRLSEEIQFDLHEFLRRILYTLPHSPEGKTPEDIARIAEQERQMGKSNKVALRSSWKNKKTLVEAIRDLAIREPRPNDFRKKQDGKLIDMSKSDADAYMADFSAEQKEFAKFVLPILEEFKSVRGKMLHNACLTALVQIKTKHHL